MNEETGSDSKTPAEETGPQTEEKVSRFPELDELQQDIQKRIRDNERFLEKFLDEDFIDEDDEEEDDPGEDFEEL